MSILGGSGIMGGQSLVSDLNRSVVRKRRLQKRGGLPAAIIRAPATGGRTTSPVLGRAAVA